MRQILVITSCFAALVFSQPVAAQDEPLVTKDVLVLQSTKDYQTALATARQAAARLHLTLNLEGYRPNTHSGLTMSKADCADNGFEYPAYIARGREDENHAFVSIEYSNGYDKFAKGYYLVVAAVGEPGAAMVRNAKAISRHWYADAYAKQTRIWVGCIH